ncbi:uncharacterized protein LOC121941135 [Plectropomus leopardus]|uniref:uncharacterized protein LOC121941135 n=1 Tax=Plectropomus leopardus TaxID=160734 RepID=UPI001C4B884A|nr:uncharacterized protein LOC121941135 [Plectropomus leopardus]
MVDNIVLKPLGLVLIITAHMVFNGPSRAEVTGILGTNITLQFKFNVTVNKNSYFAFYTRNLKIAEYNGRSNSKRGDMNFYPNKTSVFCQITNLTRNHSGIYWATLLDSRPAQESNKVELIVREENRNSTVSPTLNDITINKDSGSPSFFSSHVVTVLVVSPVGLLAAVLLCLSLIWFFLRTKDIQQPPPEQSSNPTVQETIEVSNSVPAPPLIYSILDFPKRPPAVVTFDPNDIEYADVSYLP